MPKDKLFGAADISKMFAGYAFPGFDVEALMAAQRKNLEALTQANQLAVDGFQALARKHVDLTRAAIDEVSTLVREWAETGVPEEKFQKQAEFAKKALTKGVSNSRELVELAGKTQAQAFQVLNKRFNESLDEMTSFVKNGAKTA